MRRAARLAIAGSLLGLGLTGCQTIAAGGACEREAWVDPADPLAIPVRASGVVSWEPGDPELELEGALGTVEGSGAITTLGIDTADGALAVEIGLARERLGVLPIGEAVRVALGDGIAITDGEDRLRMAVVSRRDRDEAIAASLTFRQAYAECVVATEEALCTRAMAAPLVDVVTGASIVRLPPGGVWRIPDDVDPSAEIEIVRSVRAPRDEELDGLASPPCAAAAAQEIGAIVRRLR